MNPNLTSARTIADIISEELELMTALVQLLKNEEQILIDNLPEKLALLVTDKNSLLMQIISLEKNRNELLTQSGFGTDAEGMSSYLASLSEQKNVESNWQKLLDLSATAKENNRTNGILINRQMTRNQSTLNILQQNDQSAAVYGADGQSRINANSGRGIVAG